MKNLRLDSPDSVKQHAQAIYQQAVVQKLMPMNNATGITDAERALMGSGLRRGAYGALTALNPPPEADLFATSPAASMAHYR
jgi:hypothetical protein